MKKKEVKNMKTKIYNKISTFVLVFLALVIFGATNTKAEPGDLDLSFGSGGFVVTSITNPPYSDVPRSMQGQPDGKIVVCGEILEYDSDGNDSAVSFFLARYYQYLRQIRRLRKQVWSDKYCLTC